MINKIIQLVLKKVRRNNKPFSHSIWSGDYPNWYEAKKNCTGYEAENILNKCKSSLLQIKHKTSVYERDSVLFDKKYYNWGVISALLQVAIENKSNLNVLDFGGSLGSSYYQNLSFIEKIDNVQWNVIEQEKFVKCGRENFEDDRLKFNYTIEECIQDKKPNVILLSSVLQYIEKPHEFIEKFLSLNINNIIIDRTAFIECEKDIITIQNVPEAIYKASYPAWFFNKENFLAHFKNCSEIIEFNSGITPPRLVNERMAHWSGFIIKK
jgi:putative methyltransferase (TIGR04325 family)